MCLLPQARQEVLRGCIRLCPGGTSVGGSPRLKGQLLAVLPGVELLNGTCYSRLGTTVDDAREMYREAVSRQVGFLGLRCMRVSPGKHRRAWPVVPAE